MSNSVLVTSATGKTGQPSVVGLDRAEPCADARLAA
jgi:hypothetical protein